jgi:hypothetical protein
MSGPSRNVEVVTVEDDDHEEEEEMIYPHEIVTAAEMRAMPEPSAAGLYPHYVPNQQSASAAAAAIRPVSSRGRPETCPYYVPVGPANGSGASASVIRPTPPANGAAAAAAAAPIRPTPEERAAATRSFASTFVTREGSEDHRRAAYGHVLTMLTGAATHPTPAFRPTAAAEVPPRARPRLDPSGFAQTPNSGGLRESNIRVIYPAEMVRLSVAGSEASFVLSVRTVQTELPLLWQAIRNLWRPFKRSPILIEGDSEALGHIVRCLSSEEQDRAFLADLSRPSLRHLEREARRFGALEIAADANRLLNPTLCTQELTDIETHVGMVVNLLTVPAVLQALCQYPVFDVLIAPLRARAETLGTSLAAEMTTFVMEWIRTREVSTAIARSRVMAGLRGDGHGVVVAGDERPSLGSVINRYAFDLLRSFNFLDIVAAAAMGARAGAATAPPARPAPPIVPPAPVQGSATVANHDARRILRRLLHPSQVD